MAMHKSRGVKERIILNAEKIMQRISEGVDHHDLEREYGITSSGYLVKILRENGFNVPPAKRGGNRSKHSATIAFVRENAEEIIQRYINGEALAKIERELGDVRKGFLVSTLAKLGYKPKEEKKMQAIRAGFTLQKNKGAQRVIANISYRRGEAPQIIRNNAATLIARHAAGETWQAIGDSLGITSCGYIVRVLKNAGFDLDAHAGEFAHDKGADYDIDMLEDFSPEFREKIGENRRRRFFDVLQNAAFVQGCTLPSERRIYARDFLFRCTGRKHYDEVKSPIEFNALFLAAACCAKNYDLASRLCAIYAKPITVTPQDRRRNDCRGCL